MGWKPASELGFDEFDGIKFTVRWFDFVLLGHFLMQAPA
jgi:hypothetical protein